MELISLFDYSSVYYKDSHNLNLLVKVKAPKLSLEGRVPVNLIACIDTSSSMHGPKMDFAKKSLLKLIDHLSKDDSLGVIEFSSRVRVLTSPEKMTQEAKASLKAKVYELTSMSATNFSGAMLEAFRQASLVDGNCRIIMFTDGEPTVGETSEDGILKILGANRLKHVSVSCFGYGAEHNARLLNDLSTQGRGNYSFIPGPDEALKAFALELGGLLSCYGQNLKFQIKPRSGVRIKEVVSDVEVKERADNGVTISIPDIYSEESKNLVLQLEVDSKTKAFPRETSVLDIDLWFDDVRTGKSQKLEGSAKLKFVKHGEQQKKFNQEVVDQLGFALIVKGQTEANLIAESGDILGAQTHFSNLRKSVDSFGVSQEVKTSGNIASMFYVDAGSYNNTRSDNYSSIRGMSSGRGNLTASNSIQADLSNSFVTTSTSIPLAKGGDIDVINFDEEQNSAAKKSLNKKQTDVQW